MTWRVSFQTISEWNIRKFTETFNWFFGKQETKSNPKWANIFLDWAKCRSFSRFSIRFIIIFDLHPDGFSSNAKLFADDTSLFSVVHDMHSSASDLNKDLKTINEWPFQWKISFNPDPNKQPHELFFTWKSKNIRHLDYLIIQKLFKTGNKNI